MILTLIKKNKETKNITSFTFKPDKPFKWIAGQYLIYSLDHKGQDTRGKMRFFTISSSPFEKNPVITTRISRKSSSFKKSLDNLKIGNSINAKGPDGDFIIKNFAKDYVFIAGGIGITPFMSILKDLKLKNKSTNILLLYSSKNNDILFKKELNTLKFNKLTVKYFMRRIYKKDIEKIKDLKTKMFYVSGPDPMVESVIKLLMKLNIQKENIKEDYFSGYKLI